MPTAALATAPVPTAAAAAPHRACRAGASRCGAPWVGQALPAQHPLPQHRLALAWPGPTLVQPLRAPVGLGLWEVTPPAPVWHLRLLLLARLPRPAAQAATAAAAGALQGRLHPHPHHPAGSSSSSRRQRSSRLCWSPPRTFGRHQGPWFLWDWAAAAAALAAGPAGIPAPALRLQHSSSSREGQWVQGPHLPTAATTAVTAHCRPPPLKLAATAAPGSRDRQWHPAPAMAAAATAACSRCSSNSSSLVLGPLTGPCTP